MIVSGGWGGRRCQPDWHFSRPLLTFTQCSIWPFKMNSTSKEGGESKIFRHCVVREGVGFGGPNAYS